jgi:hypothetical protein
MTLILEGGVGDHLALLLRAAERIAANAFQGVVLPERAAARREPPEYRAAAPRAPHPGPGGGR